MVVRLQRYCYSDEVTEIDDEMLLLCAVDFVGANDVVDFATVEGDGCRFWF